MRLACGDRTVALDAGSPGRKLAVVDGDTIFNFNGGIVAVPLVTAMGQCGWSAPDR